VILKILFRFPRKQQGRRPDVERGAGGLPPATPSSAHCRIARAQVAAALLAATALAAAAEGGGFWISPNVRMNRPQLPKPNGMLGRSAAAVAADPDGRELVAAWENVQGFCGPPAGRPCKPPSPPGITAFGYSTDGGRTWNDGGAPPVVGGGMAAGHPWLDRGGEDGRSFFLVSRTRALADGMLIGANFYRGRFTDGAFSWTDARQLPPATPGDFWRSTSVAAAKDGSGAVYLALTNLRGLCGAPSRGAGQIEVLASADEGRTWGRSAIVGRDDTFETRDARDPRCGATGTTQVSPTLAVGPRGEVYAVWQFGPYLLDYTPGPIPALFEATHDVSFRFARSLDRGRSWSAPRDAAWAWSLHDDTPVGYSKDNINNFPRLAVALDGPHRGRIYITYASALREVISFPSEQMVVSTQAWLVYSDDRGSSWSAPVPLGPPVPPTGLKRFWPTVTVEPGGRVDVLYLESQEREAGERPDDTACAAVLPTGLFRAGRISSLVDAYLVQSTDGGASFGFPVRVTSETTNWCKTQYDLGGFLEANFGNYLGISPGQGRIFAVWTDGREGVPDAYFSEVRSLPGNVLAAR
jgi:hypothetical protein